MNDVLVILFGGLLGYIIGRMGQKPTTNDETLQNQIDILQDDVKYYKDLCKWHVEQKRKELEMRDKFERECG